MRLHKISGCDNPDRKADVVFVHGLGGDAFSSWRHGRDQSTSWPHWLGAEFPDVGVWSLGYAASPTKWAKFLKIFPWISRNSGHAMHLPARATGVLDLMYLSGIGDRPLMFVSHSLGGLLTKQVLRKSSDRNDEKSRRVSDQTRAVMFLATPHHGAVLASLLNAFHMAFGATASIKDLQEHDSHLADLFDWYRNHAPVRKIQTITYYESRNVGGLLPIVNATSAHSGVGADPVELDEDHISIAKPRERDAQVCVAVRNLLNQMRSSARVTLPDVANISQIKATPTAAHEIIVRVEPRIESITRIPREFPQSAAKFFGRERECDQLAERLQEGRNTAVVGPAGFGKTALAAHALERVVGPNGNRLAQSRFPDGIVFLNLYALQGLAEPCWNELANRLCGSEFLERKSARERANEACRAKAILVIIEGGEVADGQDGRATMPELLEVLSSENRWLLLTRLNTQSVADETVFVSDTLSPKDAGALLDSLTEKRALGAEVRGDVLKLMEGHPLALNWAGNLLAHNEEDPLSLVSDWNSARLLGLSDPVKANHTLQWLFERSVRGLDNAAQQALSAAGLLAHAPFPPEIIDAVLNDMGAGGGNGTAARGALKKLAQRGLLLRTLDGNWQFTHVLGYRFARNEHSSDKHLRDRLGQWLRTSLAEGLEQRSIGKGAWSLDRLLEHSAALLRTDFDQSLWNSVATGFLYSIADRLEIIGRLDLVAFVLKNFRHWLSLLPKEKSERPFWMHQRQVLLLDEGDLLSSLGNLAGALSAFREALAVARRLAAADPSDAVWQRDLGISHHKVGGVLETQGDLAGALSAFQEALAVARRLAADPSNAQWQSDLSVSHVKVGGVLETQGNLAGALSAFREALAVARRLAAADPSNAEWQRDLSVSHNNMGGVLERQGDLAGALSAFQEALAVARRLAAADPSNAQWQRDLSVSHNNMGGVLERQGDLTSALSAFREALDVRRRLAAADPSNAEWQRDLSVSHNNMGGVLERQGDLAGALRAFEEALAVARQLAAADPSNTQWQRDLSYTLNGLSLLSKTSGNRDDPLKYALEGLAIAERLAAFDASNAVWQRDVAMSRNLVAQLENAR